MTAVMPNTFPSRAAQSARAELRRMRERMDAVRSSQSFMAALHEAAAEAAPPGTEEATWPTDIQEFADKISRERAGGLRPGEAGVRNRDRQMVRRALPPGIQVNMDDPPRYC